MPKRKVALPLQRIGYYHDRTGYPDMLFIPGWKSQQVGHALICHSENTTLVISISDREDHSTAWGVMLAECDGKVVVKSGVTKPYKRVDKAVNKVIRKLLPGCMAGKAEYQDYTEEDVDEDRLGFGTAGENNKGKRRSVRIKKPKPELTVEFAGSTKGAVVTNVPIT